MKHTPYYLYDTELFRRTVETAKAEASVIDNSHIHFAIKSNNNHKLVNIAAQEGLGADCVSGPEIAHAIACGIPANKIMFAGVGKTDEEITLAIQNGIECFNVESIPELTVIDELAASMNKTVNVAFRINPNVDAHTHANITTGLEENKFGISMRDMVDTVRLAKTMHNVRYVGLHFHIGSQVLEFTCFENLSKQINILQAELESAGITDTKIINVGGGLGVDYDNPMSNLIPDFRGYFKAYKDNLQLRPGQALHFELGRSLCAQCGELICKCVYVKDTAQKKFAILDGGMSDLIRPALYGAHHKIVNLTGDEEGRPTMKYDVVGPICESSDVFDKDVFLSEVRRGDILSIKSAGAYGFVMASAYNLRKLPLEVLK